MDILTKLAIQYKTDKGPAPEAHIRGHNYTPLYHQEFKDRKPLRLLEIGVGGYEDPYAGGESLRMWADYFPEATIIGVDIEPKLLKFSQSNIIIEQGSQVDEGFLQNLVDKYGLFDIIIDDGSHLTEHHVHTFSKLFIDGLAPGGIYIIEDLATSYDDNLKLNFGSSIDYFKQFLDVVNFKHFKKVPSSVLRFHELKKDLLSMTCYEKLLIFRKKGGIQ